MANPIGAELRMAIREMADFLRSWRCLKAPMRAEGVRHVLLAGTCGCDAVPGGARAEADGKPPASGGEGRPAVPAGAGTEPGPDDAVRGGPVLAHLLPGNGGGRPVWLPSAGPVAGVECGPVQRTKGDKSKNAKMATLVIMYTLRREGDQLLGPLNRWQYASFAPKRRAFEVARREADKRGFTRASGKTVQIVTDGDNDLARYAAEYFPEAILTIDVMHVIEKLWSAGGGRRGQEHHRQALRPRRHALDQGTRRSGPPASLHRRQSNVQPRRHYQLVRRQHD